MKPDDLKRREFFRYSALGLAGVTLAGTSPARGASPEPPPAGSAKDILRRKVGETPFIDTHEHLMNESERLQAGKTIWDKANDWSFLLSHYFDSDLAGAGMSAADLDRFFSPDPDPLEKWRLIEPYWPLAKSTGYGLNVRLALKDIYGIEDLNAASVGRLQAAYRETLKPGFYRHLLRDIGNIESCQVNLWPFLESEQPDLLMSDLHLDGMIEDDWDPRYAREAGVAVKDLADWHRVIDYWLATYGKRSVAVKCIMAYHRDLDCLRTPAEEAAPAFRKKLAQDPLTKAERKTLEDHLFWYAVDGATKMDLPVKLHTGYYAGHGQMPMARVRGNPSAAGELCRLSPATRFVFFHAAYPFYEEMVAVAKHYPNAHLDLCWFWIVNPVAAKDFLKKLILAAPANKIFAFGGDYIPVELVPGHAAIARRGIVQALTELVAEEWLTLDEGLDLADAIMHRNARALYKL